MPNRARDWLNQAVRDLDRPKRPREKTATSGRAYPNCHPEGAPFQHYGRYQSEEAIRHAGEIVDYVRAPMAEKNRD